MTPLDRARTGRRRPAACCRGRSTPMAFRSTPARWRRATCLWRCSARAATATPSWRTRWPKARPARWCTQPWRAGRRNAAGGRRHAGGADPPRRLRPGALRRRAVVAVTGSVGKTTTKEMLRARAVRVRTDPCRGRILQQPLGPAADPGPHAAPRPVLHRRDRHEPRGRDRAARPAGAAACRGDHHDRQGACRASRQHRGDRRRKSRHHPAAWNRAGSRFSPPNSPHLPRLREAAAGATVMTFGSRSVGRCPAAGRRGGCRTDR